MITDERIAQLLDRYSYLEHSLGTPDEFSNEEFVKLSKEYSDLGPIVEAAKALRDGRQEMVDLAEMMESGDDPEMKELAQEEFHDLKERLPEMDRELSIALLPKDAADERSAIVEIRAGTGGDEAALFAGDLYRMYEGYAASNGWKVEMISSSASEVGGFKEVVANVTGQGVFARLKFESGVHRVQRVPSTESGGRIHTSAATVAVLPEAEEVDLDIKQEDFRIDTMRASGSGGQHVNTTDSAVRITHIPTGIMVVQSEKSQHKNRDKAMKIMMARLYEVEREKLHAERSEDRKSQVGSGDRSERIRTYNFPQGRVTDHRIGLTLHKLDQVLAGDGLSEVVEALISEDQAERLSAMENGF
ncbi:peptide chain release factor 1 [Kordiimonas sp. SCSIO 12603]|uniref:peptide chain release factor 1 n=1 Tax=Kordiimonas sp. SCSIO 12603 TaxID=2829596 RepID=UPI0021023C15|nr:peptide chain release factor 1 [Kordiimonas sp. SCSIO 12603]UTW59497.1 peptide chain release factor 1 [Kordiimonas sp. SCSIO 12603]